MKRVLFLLPRMGGGGAERVVSIIANNLSSKYSIQITTLVSDESFYRLNKNVRLTSANYRINRKNKFTRFLCLGRNFLNAINYTRKTIKEYNPAIVFSLLEEMDIVTWLATRGLLGIKWICSERNDPTKRNYSLQRLLEFIYKKSDLLVCQTETVANYYAKISRKCVIPNPVIFNNCSLRKSESSPPRIVAVGRLVSQKNFMMLIEAFSLIACDYPEVTVTIYGEGPERKKLEEQIKKKKLDDRVFLPGISHNILNNISDASIFAMPTNYEGFPNALIEAISLGIPVVTTDFATGVAKEIVNADVGLLVPCSDVRAFANALSILLSNKTLRGHIRSVASQQVLKSFSVDKIITMWDKVFQKL